MPLEFQLAQHPFRFGLAEGTEPHQVQPGTLTTAENVVWKKSGKIEKRFGISALAASVVGGGSIAAGSRLFARGSELCLIDGLSCYAYAPTATAWKNVGKVPNLGLTWTTLVDTSKGVQSYDSATSASGYRVDAWVDSDPIIGTGAMCVQVVDTNANSVLVAPIQKVTSGALGVRVVILGTTAVVVTSTSAGVNLAAFTVDLSTFTISNSATNLRTDGAAGVGWDVCLVGSTFVLCYTNNATALKLYSYNAALVQQATGGITGETLGAYAVCLGGASGEVLYVAYIQTTTAAPQRLVRIAMADPATLVQTVAPVTVETPAVSDLASLVGVCRYDATNCVMSYALPGTGATGRQRTMTYKISSAGIVAATSERGTWCTRPVSRPFMLSGACYMMAADHGAARSPDA